MLNTTHPLTAINPKNMDISELNVISHYPDKYALEMYFLIRRISLLKSMCQPSTKEQLESLMDVYNLEDFIVSLLKTKNMDAGDFFISVYPNGSYEYISTSDKEDN